MKAVPGVLVRWSMRSAEVESVSSVMVKKSLARVMKSGR